VDWVAVLIAAFVGSWLLTRAMREIAARRGVVDVPNARSSHGSPMPRGGGVAIVVTTTLALLILTLLHLLRVDLLLALVGGGLAVAWVGFADDHRSLSAATRLTVHFAAAVWALVCLGGLPPLQVGTHLLSFGRGGYVLGALGIVWTLNLFNFMDGIDGIAGAEAIFIALAGALLTWVTGGDTSVALVAVTFAAACAGFVVWNWPPAKIFMGDVGSGYVGYVIAVLSLAAAHDSPSAIWIWLLLGSVFFVDATVTLARRLIRGERLSEAHRSHAYQWLARRWGSHLRVTAVMMAVNLLLLLPCALLAALRPIFAFWIVLGLLISGGLAAVAAGSGRPEGLH
jgi:Fuc2NAc and GlcNAc transferase